MPTEQELSNFYSCLGSRPGDLNWDSAKDLDGSGLVDGYDLALYMTGGNAPGVDQQFGVEVSEWGSQCSSFTAVYGASYQGGNPFDFDGDSVIGPPDRVTFLTNIGTARAKMDDLANAYGQQATAQANGGWRVYDGDADGVVGPEDYRGVLSILGVDGTPLPLVPTWGPVTAADPDGWGIEDFSSPSPPNWGAPPVPGQGLCPPGAVVNPDGQGGWIVSWKVKFFDVNDPQYNVIRVGPNGTETARYWPQGSIQFRITWTGNGVKLEMRSFNAAQSDPWYPYPPPPPPSGAPQLPTTTRIFGAAALLAQVMDGLLEYPNATERCEALVNRMVTVTNSVKECYAALLALYAVQYERVHNQLLTVNQECQNFKAAAEANLMRAVTEIGRRSEAAKAAWTYWVGRTCGGITDGTTLDGKTYKAASDVRELAALYNDSVSNLEGWTKSINDALATCGSV